MLPNSLGLIVKEEWQRTAVLRQNIILDVYVVMPYHFHAILVINNPAGRRPEMMGKPQFAPTVGDIMQEFKQAVTLRMRALGYPGNVWQRGYYDHIIRNIHDYEAIVECIINNPQNW